MIDQTPATYLTTAARFETHAETIDTRAAEVERRLPPAVECDPIVQLLTAPPTGVTLDRLRARSLRAHAHKLRHTAEREVGRWWAGRVSMDY